MDLVSEYLVQYLVSRILLGRFDFLDSFYIWFAKFGSIDLVGRFGISPQGMNLIQ